VNPGRLILRADAGPGIGAGHAMRMLALGAAWTARGHTAVWVSHDPPPALARRFEDLGIAVRPHPARHPDPADMLELVAMVRAQGGGWAALDGYHFDESCQGLLKNAGAGVLWMDDTGACSRYSADVVINQNAWHDPAWYRDIAPECTLLAGPAYALLRPDFLAAPIPDRAQDGQERRVLVSTGGADPLGIAPRIVEGLARVGGLEVQVTPGMAGPSRDSLVRACERAGAEFSVIGEAGDIPRLMSWAGLAILAGGVSCLEAAFMGLPMLLSTLADNQRGNVSGLCAAGAAQFLGEGPDITPEQVAGLVPGLLGCQETRLAMAGAGRRLVDGKGTRRALAAMLAGRLSLRRAREEDSLFILRLANDPAARLYALNQEPISEQTHTRWFTRKLCDPDCLIFAAEGGSGLPAGQIRFEREHGAARISYSIDPSLRGLGLGPEVLRLGLEAMRQAWGDDVPAFGYVKRENAASAVCFRRAGFSLSGIPGPDGASVFICGQLSGPEGKSWGQP
jgi:UDP-2,4-diacetamido-2,4,6-trideoxy-beta-L-altropyranose hydrolase